MRESTTQVIAIACADIHLQHTPPPCRSGEADWYEAMARPLKEIKQLAYEHDVPILCAGDIFDRWDSKPELINWAIANLPVMYSIPGQHDLPQHRYEDKYKSAYWTLVKAHILKELIPGQDYVLNDSLCIWGFPWGYEIKKNIQHQFHEPSTVLVALCHEYAWIKGHSYPGADTASRVSVTRENLRNFDVVVFGDNHSGFLTKVLDTTILNCGTLMRRRSDEKDYKPHVGLIRADGSVTPHYLDTSKESFTTTVKETAETEGLDATEFMLKLNELSRDNLDFRAAVEEFISDNRVDDAVRAVLVEAMENQS